MQHSRHIGKIVLRIDGTGHSPIINANKESRRIISSDATYLVTGGRGGFGLATTEWLSQKGARHIVVVGRSPVASPDAASGVGLLRSNGVDVRELVVDVSDAGAVAQMLDQIRHEMPPLRGIIHCAAVIQDASLVNMTLDNFRDVLRPKIAGAWNLHKQTLDEKLDFFVMYSSAITLFGNEGQANYAAANLFLEALASHRHGLGLPGLSVAWGPIANVGRLARDAAVNDIVKERLGVKLLSPGRALEALERTIEVGTAGIALTEFNWSRLAVLPGIAKDPKYELVRELMSGASGGGADVPLEELRALFAGKSYEEAAAFVQGHLVKQVAGIIGMAPSRIVQDRPLTELGMDSLMLVELQLALEKQFGIAIPTLELMDLATVANLGRRILNQVGITPQDGPTAVRTIVTDSVETERVHDTDISPAPSIDTAFEATLGRLLERELDRTKEHPH